MGTSQYIRETTTILDSFEIQLQEMGSDGMIWTHKMRTIS